MKLKRPFDWHFSESYRPAVTGVLLKRIDRKGMEFHPRTCSNNHSCASEDVEEKRKRDVNTNFLFYTRMIFATIRKDGNREHNGWDCVVRIEHVHLLKDFPE